jgi:REP element-mobilizing transposase RayT
MSRHARIQSGTGIYHTMLRGVNRQEIFMNDDDRIKFIQILTQQVSPKDDLGLPLPARCTIYAYCLMPNHVHLLMRESSEAIGETMKRIAQTYAHYFNWRHQRIGHLFQERFRSEPVNDMEYFITLIRYIHQNPIAGGLSKTVADYPWSSWHEYISQTSNCPKICNTSHVFKRITLEDLIELVNEPMAKASKILDIDTVGKRTDEEVRDFLSHIFPQLSISNLTNVERYQQKQVISMAIEYGAGLRQIVRITGIPYGIVRQIK